MNAKRDRGSDSTQLHARILSSRDPLSCLDNSMMFQDAIAKQESKVGQRPHAAAQPKPGEP
jgi:hypothetical protein